MQTLFKNGRRLNILLQARVKIILNFLHDNEVITANLYAYKRISNRRPFMNKVYTTTKKMLINSSRPYASEMYIYKRENYVIFTYRYFIKEIPNGFLCLHTLIQTLWMLLDFRKAKNTRLAFRVFLTLISSLATSRVFGSEYSNAENRFSLIIATLEAINFKTVLVRI